MPAILVLFTQLFRGPLSVLTDSLVERLVLRDLHTKTATADNLLFRRRGFLKRKAAFPFSSRTVRSRTTEKFLRMKVEFVLRIFQRQKSVNVQAFIPQTAVK